MKKIKKLIFIFILFVITFLIYKFFNSNKIIYISLGDSLAKGENAYGNNYYGYSDYIMEYLEKNNKLRYYSKDFATEGYRITDIINDINNNKKIYFNKNKEGIKTILRKADLLTLSIGANDILYKVENNINNINIDELNEYINELINDYDKLLCEITKYFKGSIFLIGYYNPYVNNNVTNKNNLEKNFIYTNEQLNELSKKYKAKFINVYEIFNENSNFLPVKNNIHPSIEGHKQIANLIINELKK